MEGIMGTEDTEWSKQLSCDVLAKTQIKETWEDVSSCYMKLFFLVKNIFF